MNITVGFYDKGGFCAGNKRSASCNQFWDFHAVSCCSSHALECGCFGDDCRHLRCSSEIGKHGATHFDWNRMSVLRGERGKSVRVSTVSVTMSVRSCWILKESPNSGTWITLSDVLLLLTEGKFYVRSVLSVDGMVQD